ncbi:hypothetical protein [Yoonia sediminilitoris]|uniref:Secreted protein n=1 Tax=Yoonia sediminilitoris TaxID=1286148 RepID=A0A2T6K7S0_9RHOB|nr:hypothetical protein [Yoonia sediminilitoris]PUB10727.1 hypothetical protein C8N45_11772 [Yoonia sediminilitoris]RCW90479.1 hypothetical protein DFP92_11772 [Yoonia sediminilitoris]
MRLFTCTGLLWLLSLTAAVAQDCPDIIRFVDFGRYDAAGGIMRGGPIIRVVDESTQLLMERPERCVKVEQLHVDGHNHPIPIVPKIRFDPTTVSADLSSLVVQGQVNDIPARQELSAVPYLQMRSRNHVVIRTSETAICVTASQPPDSPIACQLSNPFGGPLPVMLTCYDGTCELPVLTLDKNTMISAVWSVPAPAGNVTRLDALATAGTVSTAMLADIHHFLAPKISL